MGENFEKEKNEKNEKNEKKKKNVRFDGKIISNTGEITMLNNKFEPNFVDELTYNPQHTYIQKESYKKEKKLEDVIAALRSGNTWDPSNSSEYWNVDIPDTLTYKEIEEAEEIIRQEKINKSKCKKTKQNNSNCIISGGKKNITS